MARRPRKISEIPEFQPPAPKATRKPAAAPSPAAAPVAPHDYRPDLAAAKLAWTNSKNGADRLAMEPRLKELRALVRAQNG